MLRRCAKMALSRKRILEVASEVNQLHHQVHATFRERSQGPKQLQKWHAATDAWHAFNNPLDYLWSEEFLTSLKKGERSSVEDAILYLEVDPWYDCSGYLKEKLIKNLNANNLTERDKKRLRFVVWNVVSGRNRREFKNYCNLAFRVCDKEFLNQLEEVPREKDSASQGKFSYLERYLKMRLQEAQQGAAHKSDPRAE